MSVFFFCRFGNLEENFVYNVELLLLEWVLLKGVCFVLRFEFISFFLWWFMLCWVVMCDDNFWEVVVLVVSNFGLNLG